MYLMVALRKESVDRNETTEYDKKAALEVALRKESVDRNVEKINKKRLTFGRSPQGERG